MPAPFLDEPPVPQTLFNYIRLHYIRLVTLDCITKTGSFMTCDGNITLHYITLHYITRRHYLIPCDGIKVNRHHKVQDTPRQRIANEDSDGNFPIMSCACAS